MAVPSALDLGTLCWFAMSKSNEILRAAQELDLTCVRLDSISAASHIARAIARFAPLRTTEHLMIGHDSDAYPLELAELDYSSAFEPGAALVFFDQESTDRREVLEISDGPRLAELMANCFGMEYFVTNALCEYLVAVNWYVVEVAGVARQRMLPRFAEGERSRG